jgi:glutamyl-tRNA synthetase
MILGPDGKRLSKRHGATAIGEYHGLGILPAALLNFLALLGWSTGSDDEILPVEEIIRRFSLEAINKKSAVFDVQKLEWMNGRYLAAATAEELTPLVSERMIAHGFADGATLRRRWDWLVRLVELLKIRARTVDELARQAEPFLHERVFYDPDAVEKHWKERGIVRGRLRDMRARFAAADAWEPSVLEEVLRGLATELGVGAGKLIHPLRVALIGTASGPGIFEVAVLLGRDAVLSRLDSALESLQNGA